MTLKLTEVNKGGSSWLVQFDDSQLGVSRFWQVSWFCLDARAVNT